jgi:hypothetical protein
VWVSQHASDAGQAIFDDPVTWVSSGIHGPAAPPEQDEIER